MSASNALRIRYMIDNCEIAGPNITAIETVCGEVWNNRTSTATAGATTSPPATALKVVKHRKPMSVERRKALSVAAKARAATAKAAKLNAQVAKAGKKAKELAATA